jgi:hypothetical protein
MKSTVIIGCDNLGCGLREHEADDGGEFTAWIINRSLVGMRDTVEGDYEAYDQKSYNEQGSQACHELHDGPVEPHTSPNRGKKTGYCENAPCETSMHDFGTPVTVACLWCAMLCAI